MFHFKMFEFVFNAEFSITNNSDINPFLLQCICGKAGFDLFKFNFLSKDSLSLNCMHLYYCFKI